MSSTDVEMPDTVRVTVLIVERVDDSHFRVSVPVLSIERTFVVEADAIPGPLQPERRAGRQRSLAKLLLATIDVEQARQGQLCARSWGRWTNVGAHGPDVTFADVQALQQHDEERRSGVAP